MFGRLTCSSTFVRATLTQIACLSWSFLELLHYRYHGNREGRAVRQGQECEPADCQICCVLFPLGPILPLYVRYAFGSVCISRQNKAARTITHEWLVGIICRLRTQNNAAFCGFTGPNFQDIWCRFLRFGYVVHDQSSAKLGLKVVLCLHSPTTVSTMQIAVRRWHSNVISCCCKSSLMDA